MSFIGGIGYQTITQGPNGTSFTQGVTDGINDQSITYGPEGISVSMTSATGGMGNCMTDPFCCDPFMMNPFSDPLMMDPFMMGLMNPGLGLDALGLGCTGLRMNNMGRGLGLNPLRIGRLPSVETFALENSFRPEGLRREGAIGTMADIATGIGLAGTIARGIDWLSNIFSSSNKS